MAKRPLGLISKASNDLKREFKGKIFKWPSLTYYLEVKIPNLKWPGQIVFLLSCKKILCGGSGGSFVLICNVQFLLGLIKPNTPIWYNLPVGQQWPFHRLVASTKQGRRFTNLILNLSL